MKKTILFGGSGFFGPDRRRRSLDVKGQDRRDRTAEINERRKRQGHFNGPDKRGARQDTRAPDTFVQRSR